MKTRPVTLVLLLLALVSASSTLAAQSARCQDGSFSYSASRSGTCSGHKGVAEWLTAPAPPAPVVYAVPAAPAPVQRAVATTTTSATGAVITRDEKGRILRSAQARHAFARVTGFPNGRPGWIIDHIVALACGGADKPSNMQWQTVAEAKAKDKTERKGC
jgi:hypothetical protein